MKKVLEKINTLETDKAYSQLMQFCNSSRWATAMLKSRPYASLEHMLKLSASLWNKSEESDILEAFEGHPKIGDLTALKSKHSLNTMHEQGQVEHTSNHTLQLLQERNTEYEKKFGFIFIVCATGKSAQEMLKMIEERLQNDRKTELKNGSENQLKIIQVRIKRWWQE